MPRLPFSVFLYSRHRLMACPCDSSSLSRALRALPGSRLSRFAAAREKRAGKGPASDAWDIDDHLIALKARIVSLRTIGTGLLSTPVHAHGALWPGVSGTPSVTDLAAALQDAGSRLDAWKRSSARAGADQVLQHVLSWYEGLDLDVIKTLRTISLGTLIPPRSGCVKRPRTALRVG